jgi:membrane-associated phospholipid phosphatase
VNWKAARTSAGLCLLFLVVYGGSNWLTAHRQNIGSYYFLWEKWIPFLPWVILPYMSIDLFFIAAPFLCRSDSERQTLARRIVAAIFVSGVFFLLMPLRFAFDRPHVDGLLGIIFNNFRLLDQPYNQFPSLHIALLFILAPVYTRRSRLWWIWFTLIGLSTVLTYQHHVVDIAGGAALAVVCCYVFRNSIVTRASGPCVLDPDSNDIGFQSHQARAGGPCHSWNLSVGVTYLLGCLVLTTLAIVLCPVGFLLLWPAASLVIVASGYFGVGAAIYRKSNGHLPMVTKMMLWPALLGQHISLMHYRRQCEPWNVLTERIWIGRKLNATEAAKAVRGGVGAVLDLTGEFSECEIFRSIKYMQLPILDLTAPTFDELKQAIDFIENGPGIVYIHCKIGYSRTAAVAGCYLLASGVADSPEQAIAMLRAARPSIIIRPEAERAIRNFRGIGEGPRLLIGRHNNYQAAAD